ncbi:MAG: NifU family protein [Pirellulales bacterium]
MTMTQPDSRTSAPSLTVEDFEQLAQMVDQAIAEVQSLSPELRVKALALKAAIEEFHKIGLTHIVRTLKADPRGKELLFELVEQPSVYALFSMHGLIRADLRTQVMRVIEMVRPYMQSHGGDVAFVDLRDRTVLVRLIGNCSGCSMSQVTLRNTVEETLKQHFPEIEGVEVVTEPSVNVVQIQIGNAATDSGWIEGPAIADIPQDRPFAFSNAGVSVLLIYSKKGLRAYRNSCAHQGLPLDGGELDLEEGTITCPWHRFCFDTESGECLTAPQCQLEPFPLRIANNRVWIRPEH